MNPIQWLSEIMLVGLNFFYSVTGNYGFSIIMLTVAINMALYPLTASSIKQMGAMQKLQPLMKEIQEKYKKEPQKQQKEIMELYKSEKVNPLGGCLPMLLKIPFFLALFFALQSKEFISLVSQPNINSGFLWISNLAKPDPAYVMVALVGITTYFSQKTMPQVSDAGQGIGKSMTTFMPMFIAFISISFPAGVQIYWVVANLVAIGQQLYISKGA